ncbi:MAG TPA: NrfD/PsrC family molybdoenzyme membrane anchor subunit [Candidatus Limnocylindrales bacterium]
MSVASTTIPTTTARRRPPPAMVAWIALLVGLIAIGLAAFAYQFANGLSVTGMRNVVMWGQYILFFMFFVGLSAGGLIVASAGRLFGVKAFKPITRLAVLEATVAVVLAATFILPDLGRPERILNIPLYFNVTSPMVWDIAIVMAYMAMSTFYVWLYTRADLARRGSWLALGTGVSERALAREERVKSAMAWVALPAAIMLHSITAWIFGLQIGRGFWYSSIMAPMFIASALVSGMGLVILLALVLRRLGRLVFDDSLVAMLGGLLGVFISVEGFLLLAEYLTATYPGAPDGEAAARMLSGPYLPLFLSEVAGGLAIPFAILAVRRLRQNPRWVALAAGIGVVGIFIHRLNLILNGLSVPNLRLPPGLPIGLPQDGASSFSMYYWYVPTVVEWLIVLGVLAFGALLFTTAVWYLPLQEHGAHEAAGEPEER